MFDIVCISSILSLFYGYILDRHVKMCFIFDFLDVKLRANLSPRGKLHLSLCCHRKEVWVVPLCIFLYNMRLEAYDMLLTNDY